MTILSYPPKPILTIAELADFLSVSQRTLQRWRRRPNDPLPSCKPSKGHRGDVLFILEDVIRWLRRQAPPGLAIVPGCEELHSTEGGPDDASPSP